MATPWFDPLWFGILFGSVAGGLGGTLAGLWGAMAGVLAPQGKARGLVLGGFFAFAGLGLISLALGVVALVVGQPYAIWFPLLLVGIILPGVMGPLIPVVQKRYAEAEARRLEAKAIRHG